MGGGYPRFRLAIRQQLAKITVFFVCCCCCSCAILLLKRGRGVAFSAKQLNDAVDALINKADKQQEEEEDHTKGTYDIYCEAASSRFLPTCLIPYNNAAALPQLQHMLHISLVLIFLLLLLRLLLLAFVLCLLGIFLCYQ